MDKRNAELEQAAKAGDLHAISMHMLKKKKEYELLHKRVENGSPSAIKELSKDMNKKQSKVISLSVQYHIIHRSQFNDICGK